MLYIYGIKNCDTVKKALKHLKERGLDFEFYDFKKQDPTSEQILRWKKFIGDWPVNKKGRTYRMLKDDFEEASEAQKKKLIVSNSSLIKRPIIEKNGKVICLGYDSDIIDNL